MSASASPPPYALRNEAFASALIDPDVEIPDGIGSKDGPAPKRFSVYRNNVVVSLMEAMKAAYPSILAIMGAENFDKVSRNYILHHPPSTPLMQQFGQQFPQFIEGFRPLANSPFLVDLAQIEMNWLKAFHGLDAPVLSTDGLGAIPPDETLNLVFQPHPSAYIFNSPFPVFDLFNARNIWPCPGIDLQNGQKLIITRPLHHCQVEPIEDWQFDFITHLSKGNTLGSAINNGIETYADFDPTQAISLLLTSGFFQEIDSPN